MSDTFKTSASKILSETFFSFFEKGNFMCNIMLIYERYANAANCELVLVLTYFDICNSQIGIKFANLHCVIVLILVELQGNILFLLPLGGAIPKKVR